MSMSEARALQWYEQHAAALAGARRACLERSGFSLFAETPDGHPGGLDAQLAGAAAMRAQLGRSFELAQPGTLDRIGEEVSPYTGEALGIDYPRPDLDVLFASARAAMPDWADATPRARLGVCMQIIERLHAQLFESVHAVMHTAGQSALMSYAGSGTNALDRGVEALAYAEAAMADIPPTAVWERRFGSATLALHKRYRLVPRGVAVCFTCATFPTWNAYPSMFASLATGNAVIVKPHPTAVWPMAIAVRICREVIEAAGYSPDLVTLCCDSTAEPAGKRLVKHPHTAIVDFTGSARFGAWVEREAPPALCYTETSGVNTVVVDSVDALEPVVKSLATTMSLFSAQMCTSPQNIYVPRNGIRGDGRRVDPREFGEALAAALHAIATDSRRAGNILAAIQSPATLALVDAMAEAARRRGRVLHEPAPYVHGEFPAARTCTPLLAAFDDGAADLHGEERFGPIGFVIATQDRDAALAQASADAHRQGGITAFVYSTDERYLERAERAYSSAGAQLTCNLTGPMPLNFAAAYSDFHVSGLNPAGNATLTDLAFVASRFRVTQMRRPVR